jgi:hypothetical protein
MSLTSDHLYLRFEYIILGITQEASQGSVADVKPETVALLVDNSSEMVILKRELDTKNTLNMSMQTTLGVALHVIAATKKAMGAAEDE